jgi:hypothetical protein
MCGYVTYVLDCRVVLCLGAEQREPQQKSQFAVISNAKGLENNIVKRSSNYLIK